MEYQPFLKQENVSYMNKVIRLVNI